MQSKGIIKKVLKSNKKAAFLDYISLKTLLFNCLLHKK